MGWAKLGSCPRSGAEHWCFRSQTFAVAERTEGFGDGARNGGILGVGVGIVGILGPGHKAHMRRARMYLE
jgi:hypothetical protein